MAGNLGSIQEGCRKLHPIGLRQGFSEVASEGPRVATFANYLRPPFCNLCHPQIHCLERRRLDRF